MKKEFTRKISLLLCSLTIFVACSQTAHKNVGLQLYSLRDDMKKDVISTIAKVGEIGYTFVEAAGYSDGKFYNMEPLKFKALLNENGLEFLASHTGQPVPDSSHWNETMTWWDACIDAHDQAGVKYIVQPFMDKIGYNSLEGLKRYCDYFNAIGEKCNAKGIRFGYHNHDKEFQEIDGTIRYDYMLQNTDPDKVMFQLDLYWIMKGGKDAMAYFKKYPHRFELWHVKDEKELVENGSVDFERIFLEKEISGMKHFIVEVERYNFTPIESVQKSFNFIMNAKYIK